MKNGERLMTQTGKYETIKQDATTHDQYDPAHNEYDQMNEDLESMKATYCQ